MKETSTINQFTKLNQKDFHACSEQSFEHKFLMNSELENLPGNVWHAGSNKMKLAQLADLKAIEPMLENISRFCNVSCELIDVNGEILIAALNENICENFHRKHPVAFANCKRNREKIMQVSPGQDYEEFTCQNGLTDIVIPVCIHGQLLAALFIGPFLRKKNEIIISSFRQQVKAYGMDESTYNDALNSIAVLNEEHTIYLVNIFSGLINLIKSVALRDLAIASEIGEIRKRDYEIIEAKKQAEEAEKLKSAFLANMSHEIRTPMNSIIGFSELMGRENLEEEDRLSFISIIKESGQNLLELIDDLIDLSRIDSNQVVITKQAFDIIELLNEVHLLFTEQAAVFNKSHIRLILDHPFAEPVMIYSDRIRVKQVLSNLLRNAYKFSDNGSIQFGCRKKDEELFFYVKDSGIGISPEQQVFIFERFRQGENNLSRKFGGAGLGLSIAKDLCMLLGGRIWLESEINTGSLFSFSLGKDAILSK